MERTESPLNFTAHAKLLRKPYRTPRSTKSQSKGNTREKKNRAAFKTIAVKKCQDKRHKEPKETSPCFTRKISVRIHDIFATIRAGSGPCRAATACTLLYPLVLRAFQCPAAHTKVSHLIWMCAEDPHRTSEP